jgi:uncharacterized RDD family membrane protein YckC
VLDDECHRATLEPKPVTTAAKPKPKPGPRCFHAHESRRLHELEGVPLATFPQRFLGYAIDVFIAVILWAPAEILWRVKVLHEQNVHLVWDFHEAGNLIFLFLYFGLANFIGNGRTPGKWIARTRAVSLTHPRLGFWQSIERALGYGAAVLEGGLGFLQFFWSDNRMCAQDRLAETIVIDERHRSVSSTPPSL